MERDAFLARVGQAMLRAHLPEPTEVRPPSHASTEPVDLVELFRSRAESVSAVVHGPMSRHAVPGVVATIASEHSARRFMAWDDLGVAGIPSALAGAGLERVDHNVPDDGRMEHNLGYAAVEVGITGSDGALAQSGSVILDHGEGRPRMASLIPDVHIVLLETGRIYRGLTDWVAESTFSPAGAANLVLVTGPSRTADIEQQLNLGVHGPRHLNVVMIG